MIRALSAELDDLFSWITCNSLDWSRSGSSPISSRNSVPLSASAIRPSFLLAGSGERSAS